MKIKDIPQAERPKEKLLKYGVTRLSNDELLAIIIGSGTSKMNALVLAKHIRKHISKITVSELKKIHGIGDTKIARILAAIEFGKRLQQKTNMEIMEPKDVWNALSDIRGSKKEYFVVFYLDIQNQLIQRETISVGSLTLSVVYPREVFEPAIKYLATQIIISHNHPSGICRPSDEDIKLTNQLSRAGDILSIVLLDHIIVGKSSFFSFKQHGLI